MFTSLANAPTQAYFADDYSILTSNVPMVPDGHVWKVQDPTSVHGAIALGALFDVLAAGQRDSPELNSLTSQLCAIVNSRLNEKQQNGEARDITIHSIAALAIIAVGSYPACELGAKSSF